MIDYRPRNRRKLMGSEVAGQTIVGDFRDGLAYNSRYENVDFVGCRLDRLVMLGSVLKDCVFRDCTMNQVNLNSTKFAGVSFVGCELDQATFESSALYDVQFSGGRAEYASFRDASLHDVAFDLQLHGADLRFAAGEDVSYGDSNLWGASVNASCANFAGAWFSERSIKLFLGLLCQTKGAEKVTRPLWESLDSRTRSMIRKLVEGGKEPSPKPLVRNRRQKSSGSKRSMRETSLRLARPA